MMKEYVGYEKKSEFPIIDGSHPKYAVLTDEEIIRCRDCKWYAEVPCELDASFILYTCTRADFCMPSGGNGFCSWAERDDQ